MFLFLENLFGYLCLFSMYGIYISNHKCQIIFDLHIIRSFLYCTHTVFSLFVKYMKNPHILFVLTILCAFFTTLFSLTFLQGIGFV